MRSSRSALLVFGMVLILVVVNAMIASKERQVAGARRVVLELAPVDPRSLIQGDYMRLAYIIDGELRALGSGTAYLELDSRDVALSVHKEPQSGRQKLRFSIKGGRAEFGASSFLFQEGRREHYEQARYGELKVDSQGRATLVNLLDQDLKPL